MIKRLAVISPLFILDKIIDPLFGTIFSPFSSVGIIIAALSFRLIKPNTAGKFIIWWLRYEISLIAGQIFGLIISGVLGLIFLGFLPTLAWEIIIITILARRFYREFKNPSITEDVAVTRP